MGFIEAKQILEHYGQHPLPIFDFFQGPKYHSQSENPPSAKEEQTDAEPVGIPGLKREDITNLLNEEKLQRSPATTKRAEQQWTDTQWLEYKRARQNVHTDSAKWK